MNDARRNTLARAWHQGARLDLIPSVEQGALMLTQEKLREVMSYDPETGIFRWLITRGSCRAGHEAGCLHHRGYRVIGICGKLEMAHRLAFLYMTGKFPEHEVDHIDRSEGNNKWANLRECTRGENARNRGLHRNSSTGLKGVRFNKKRGKFSSRIACNGSSKDLGSFATADEAFAAYCAAARELHGDFANFGVSA